MENILQELLNNIVSVSVASLIAMVTYILNILGKKLKSILDDKKIRDYVDDVVKFVNQAYETLTNEEKYATAEKEITEWLNTEGIKIAESKLKVLIESAVSKNKKGE